MNYLNSENFSRKTFKGSALPAAIIFLLLSLLLNNLNGFNFWLAKLDQFNGNFVSADMVKDFMRSTECRGRFGPL